MIGIAFGGVAQEPDRPRGLVGVGVGKGERKLAAGARVGVEQRLELANPAGAIPGRAVDIGQLFAGRDQPRCERDCPFERPLSIARTLQLAQTGAQEVVGIGQPPVEGDRTRERFRGLGRLPDRELRQTQLVEHTGGAVVEPDERREILGGALRLLSRQFDVAAELQGPGRGRVAGRRGREIVGRRVELAAPEMGFAPLQIAEHRLRLEDNRLVEMRQRPERVPASQRELPLQHCPAIQPLPAGHRVAVQNRDHGQRQRNDDGGALQGRVLTGPTIPLKRAVSRGPASRIGRGGQRAELCPAAGI